MYKFRLEFKREFLTAQIVKIWKGLQNRARNLSGCKMELDKKNSWKEELSWWHEGLSF